MVVVWILVLLIFLGVIAVGLADAVFAESGLEPVRVTREAADVGLAVGGLVLYLLIIGEHLSLGWTVAAIVVGILAGYGDTWRGGHDALSGIALVPSSRLFPVTYLVSMTVVLIGSLGVPSLLTVGLFGHHMAVALGIGRFAYRFEAARRAAIVFSAETWVAIERVCERCTSSLEPGDRYCHDCGAEQPHTCAACGSSIAVGATSCEACGATTSVPPEPMPDATWRRTCLVCTTPLGVEANYCPTCGVSAPPACSFCGGPALPGELDCPVCGIDLEVAEVAAADDASSAVAGAPTSCGECEAVNRAGNRFCNECGSLL